jgi:hypothetical protein
MYKEYSSQGFGSLPTKVWNIAACCMAAYRNLQSSYFEPDADNSTAMAFAMKPGLEISLEHTG